MDEMELSFKELYNRPPRAYHNWDHVLGCFTELADTLQRPYSGMVFMGLVFHDIIYDVHRHDNEEKSAEFAREWLTRHNRYGNTIWSNAIITDVCHLIMATKHTGDPDSDDARLICDVDIANLGKPYAEFTEIGNKIRQEYAHVPDNIFRTKRAEIFESFLARPRIYFTDEFHTRYEAQCRENMTRAVSELRGGAAYIPNLMPQLSNAARSWWCDVKKLLIEHGAKPEDAARVIDELAAEMNDLDEMYCHADPEETLPRLLGQLGIHYDEAAE
jgi:predicted metal-dependent HD superfamily phosphohydrolase